MYKAPESTVLCLFYLGPAGRLLSDRANWQFEYEGVSSCLSGIQLTRWGAGGSFRLSDSAGCPLEVRCVCECVLACKTGSMPQVKYKIVTTN